MSVLDALKRGARHSKKDLAMLKEIRDHAATIGEHAVSLGAEDTETTDEGEGKSTQSPPVDAAVKYTPHPYPVKVVKSDDATLTVGGYGVVFGGKDMMGDTFTAETDFWLSVMTGEMPRPVLYDHGMDDAVKMFVLGKTTKIEPDETGLWVEAQLERHNRYMREVEQLIGMGVLGYSSGSVGHLVRYAETDKSSDPWGDDWFWGGGTFASWPLFEFSLTPTPAEPRTLGVGQIRSLVEAYPAAKSLLAGLRGQGQGAREAQAVKGASGPLATDHQPPSTISVSTPSDGGHQTEEEEMDNEQVAAIVKAAVAEAIPGAVDAAFQAFRASLEGEPPLKKAGIAPSSVSLRRRDEELTPEQAFMLWLKMGNEAPELVKRMMRRQSSRIVGLDMGGDATKATLVEGVDAQGGTWVPEVMASTLNTPLANGSYLRVAGARVLTGIQGTNSFKVPGLTLSSRAVIGAEGSPYGQNEPGANEVEFKPWKFKKLALAAEELVEDSNFDVWSMILQPDFGQAFAEGENYYFTVGTGTNEPQGVVTGATVGVTLSNGTGQTATITSFDSLVALYHKLDYKYRAHPSCGWMMNDATLEIVSKLKDGAGRYILEQGVNGQPDRIKGKPVITNNQMDAPATSKDIIVFGSFDYYWIAPWPGMQMQRLDEKYSDTGHIGFRAFQRADGHVMQSAAFTKLRTAAS